MAETKNKVEATGPVDEKLRCACFTAYETAVFERSYTNQCSEPDCTNIATPSNLFGHVSQCTLPEMMALPKALWRSHFIPLKYCSTRCSIKRNGPPPSMAKDKEEAKGPNQ